MRVTECEHIKAVKVNVDPYELECSYGKRLPYGCCVGVVYYDGTIDVWTPAASKPRGYKEAATRLLESVKAAGGLPTRLACTYSGVDRVYADMQKSHRDRVDHIADCWLTADVAEWQTLWRTTIDDDTKAILKSRAFADAVETVDYPKRRATY